jgi:hypothetical protein
MRSRPRVSRSIERRLKKLDREADSYKDTDQADLAEGLKVKKSFSTPAPLVRTLNFARRPR